MFFLVAGNRIFSRNHVSKKAYNEIVPIASPIRVTISISEVPLTAVAQNPMMTIISSNSLY